MPLQEEVVVPLLEAGETYKEKRIIRHEASEVSISRRKIIIFIITLSVASIYIVASQTDLIIADEKLLPLKTSWREWTGVTTSEKPENGSLESNFNIKSIQDVCIHPKVDFFDKEIMQYYPKPPICTGQSKNITYFQTGKLKSYYPNDYDCWGRCQQFKSNKETVAGPWYHTNKGNVFDCDIIEARCSPIGKDIDNAIYFYIHTQVYHVPLKEPSIEVKGKQYSVYYIVVDSQAYTQTFRNLNKTNEFLINEMEAIHFPYLNRQADRSRENAIAWWFGKLTQKVERGAFNLPSLEPEPQWKDSENCKRTLDNENFLLKEFAERGYATNLAEDWWGTIDYECKGFEQMVSHHSYMPYVIVYEKDKKVGNFLEKTQCLQRHEHLLDYFTQFAQAYKGTPKVGWMWVVHVGHNNEWGSKRADPHLLEFFKKNKEEFENSFVFFGGDHGMRFTGAVKTKVGMLDVNNPLLMMTVPKDLRENKELMDTLRENAGELQTHFDTRATLLDILKYQPASNYTDRSTLEIKGELGNSLLRKQPKPRTCRTLPVPPQFCICQNPMNVDLVQKQPVTANQLGRSVAGLVNKKLSDNGVEAKCRTWVFSQTQMLTQLSDSHYQGVVVAKTGKGTEAQFKIFLSGKNEKSMEIVSLDRLDRYGNSGDCVEKALRPMCDCY